MYRSRWSDVLKWVASALCLLLAVPAFSEGTRTPDLRLLIDISETALGAEQDLQLGQSLAAFVRLLPEGSQVGIWTFDETVEQLAPVKPIDDSWREAAARALLRVKSRGSGSGSDIPAALAAASANLPAPDANYDTSILLLTSGRLDVSSSPMTNANAARQLIQKRAPALASQGIPVHTIAVSKDADRLFLANLARLTGGLAVRARSSGELARSLLRLLQTISPVSTLPVAKSRFTVDESVDAFTLLLTGDGTLNDITLYSPGGDRATREQSLPGMRWFGNDLFTLITVSKPQVGKWKFKAPDDAQAQVRVQSSLQLQIDPSLGVMPVGVSTELTLQLVLAGKKLDSAALYSQFEVSLAVVNPSGVIESLPADLVPVSVSETGYVLSLPPFKEAGSHVVKIGLRGEGLQRELPVYVEAVAANPREVISTRVEDVPEEDLKIPAIRFAVLAVVAMAVLLAVLRRRRQRKLAIWQQRFSDPEGKGQSGLFPGIRAEGERDNKRS
ncbi:MAG: vWA domain-containing protein [Halioglobus sp.]